MKGDVIGNLIFQYLSKKFAHLKFNTNLCGI